MRLQALQPALWAGIEEMDTHFITDNGLNPADWKNPEKGYTVSPLCCLCCVYTRWFMDRTRLRLFLYET
jgi:hypothetical protein